MSGEGYLHGFSEEEQARLRHQARFLEHRVHAGLPFHRSRRLLELGCGVGAQTEILLRRFPELHVTGLDSSQVHLAAARRLASTQPWVAGRVDWVEGDATRTPFAPASFDSAFLCWILEHVSDPLQVLLELRRVLRPGARVAVTEVQNASLLLEPHSPSTLAYWRAFNEHQLALGGDPFVGAKLGNLLLAAGYREIVTEIRTHHLDNRTPEERAEMFAYWSDLLLSGAPGLRAAGRVSSEVVEGMREELAALTRHPNAVFFYSFVHARAEAP